VGVPGELYIGGAGLARGYLNRPELTAQKFIVNPLSQEQNARLYKTGDLARYQSDGNIEYLGRIDNQVKVRGFRIELGEIEAVLSQHPVVQQSVVIVREDIPGNQQLVAYLVPHPEQAPPTASELRHFLKQQLPEYMAPSAFVTLDSLPLTPNGKIDRRALPAPDTTRPFEEGAYVGPQTPVEEMVAGIWAQVLAVKEVSIHDNFFDLGGHSLLATQLISRLRDTFCVELPLRGLFESPTVAGLSERLETLLRTEQGLVAPPLLPVSREGEMLLSFAQARLWFLEQLEPGSYAYNMPAAVRLTGSLNVAALKQSLQEIVQRHEALRTTFAIVSGEPLQVIAPVLALTVPLVDLCQLPEATQEVEVERLAIESAQQPFDLARGPLLRATLLQLGEAEHVLLVTMHHIVSDGWSIGVMIRELATLYEAFSTGKASPLPPLPIQYADFAHWQRQWLQGEVLAAQLSYWQQQLAGAQTVLELPTDRPRPTVQTFRGASLFLALPEPLSQKLKSLSQRSGVTLFMTLLAAFQTLLYRYTGQEDICIGSPIANRNRSETEDLIGFFVNTLILRTDMSENPSFQELLGRVREMTLGAYAHQDLPFEQLVEALQPERNLSHHPLFQVMFVLQNAPMSALELPDLTLSPLERESSTAKFDLTLSMEDTEQGLVGSLEYNTDLFDTATISRMREHFQTLLEGIVANPEQRLSDLSLLTQQERQQLLVEWNNTQVAYPKDVCIHQLFEAQVERTPDAVAVVFEDQQLTYRELNRRANQVAHHLRSLGIGSDNLVGICVERSLEMIAGLLGILKAGGAYVPLDPAYPKDRLAYILNDSQMPVLVTTEKLSTGLPEHQARLVYLDKDWGINSADSDVAPVSSVTDENLAYVIYTSGSTGKPKGVAIAHRSLVNAYLAWEDAYQLRSLCRSHLQMASLSFDVFSGDLVRALCSGAKLVICPREWLLEPEKLYELMLQEKVDCADFVPAVLRNLIQYLERTKQDLCFMRLLIVGSDSWHLKEYQQFQRFCGAQTRLINAYGVSEATIDSSYFESTAVTLSIDGLVPIGRPFANTQIYILDSHLQPVPVGVSGELHIGGVGLAQGYLNQPKLTEQKFIPNPLSNEPGDRLYKTGDLGRYLPDGTIEFLGRLDDQVKIRGFRIELGEIEAVLGQHPAMQETVVMVREDVLGNKRLVAYVVVNQPAAPTIPQLQQLLKQKLPEYMVPSAFVLMDVLPLTPNGKIDRRPLPAPDLTFPFGDGAYVAPQTPVEEMVAGIWADVLAVKQVSIHDNFFDLGGHSLIATQVMSQLQETFKIELPLRELFEKPTVAELAATIASTLHSDSTIVANTQEDLNAEVVLDPAIQPQTVSFTYTSEPKSIFLTGASGFLGAYLLYGLLEQTQADVYCLLRSANEKQAYQKLQSQMESFQIWKETFSYRIIPIVGDLSKNLLGLSASEFRDLATQIDIIYHNGAWVNTIYPYSTLKSANVLGTQEVLRLASEVKLKPVHYISTLSVFSSATYSEMERVSESDPLEDSQDINNGYAESKWVAEKLVMLARDRGLPICIYRPARILGHSQTGICNPDDLLCKFILGCIQLGMVPKFDFWAENIIPVDYMSRAIIHISRQKESLGKAFHLVNPNPTPMNDLFNWIRALGYPLEEVSYEEWRSHLIRTNQGASNNILQALMPIFSEENIETTNKTPEFDFSNTLCGLAGTDIFFPRIERGLTEKYFSDFINRGLLPKPTLLEH
jgi:amino acid adenylation domain-containing protein/thioester reductase-like protein